MSGIATSIGGQFIDVFQGVLPVSYISHEISLPAINSNQDREAHYDFEIPSDITVPMLHVAHDTGGGGSGSVYYFTRISGNSWRLTFRGLGYMQSGSQWRPNWVEPLVKAGTKLIIGGFRG